jgi:peptidyl-prolyl cis-trans isomerase B (cyclophilin B)
MTKWVSTLLVLAGSAMVFPGTSAYGTRKEKVREEVAVIDTNMGRITLRFFAQESPKTVEKFKSLVRAKFYDATLFHRVLPGLLVQGGDPQTRSEALETEVTVEPVALEKNDLKHHPGTVSMAHQKDDPNSRSEFFICLQEVNYFDGKFTIIGEVISGLKVIDSISNVPRDLKQTPLFPVRIRKLSLEMQEFIREVK